MDRELLLDELQGLRAVVDAPLQLRVLHCLENGFENRSRIITLRDQIIAAQ